MVITRAAKGIRKPCTPYRPLPSSKVPATPASSKAEDARKAYSSSPETPVKKRKSPNAHIQQTSPPKLRFNPQQEMEDEAWDKVQSSVSSVQADDAWVFSNLPIMLRPNPRKDDTDYESNEEPVKLAVSPSKPKMDNNEQCEQLDEEFIMSETEYNHSVPNYLTIREDRDKIGSMFALDSELGKLDEEAAEIERAQHPELYGIYSVTSDTDTLYDYEKNKSIEAGCLLDSVQEYSTWPATAEPDIPQDTENDDLAGERSSKKKCKVIDTSEDELYMGPLYIFREESEYEYYTENEDKPTTPCLIRSSDPIEWSLGFAKLQTPCAIEKVPQEDLCCDNLPPTLGSRNFTTVRGCADQLATPPDSNCGSASPHHGMRVAIDRDICPITSPTSSLFAKYSSPEPRTTTGRPANWGHTMPQNFLGHAKHLCKSGRTPQAELEYTCANSGFNTSFIDEIDRMYPRKIRPTMDDAVMPRTGRRSPVTEKRGNFVLAEDYTATEGRSRAQLQYWPSA